MATSWLSGLNRFLDGVEDVRYSLCHSRLEARSQFPFVLWKIQECVYLQEQNVQYREDPHAELDGVTEMDDTRRAQEGVADEAVCAYVGARASQLVTFEL
jgi:hypothetical protein